MASRIRVRAVCKPLLPGNNTEDGFFVQHCVIDVTGNIKQCTLRRLCISAHCADKAFLGFVVARVDDEKNESCMATGPVRTSLLGRLQGRLQHAHVLDAKTDPADHGCAHAEYTLPDVAVNSYRYFSKEPGREIPPPTEVELENGTRAAIVSIPAADSTKFGRYLSQVVSDAPATFGRLSADGFNSASLAKSIRDHESEAGPTATGRSWVNFLVPRRIIEPMPYLTISIKLYSHVCLSAPVIADLEIDADFEDEASSGAAAASSAKSAPTVDLSERRHYVVDSLQHHYTPAPDSGEDGMCDFNELANIAVGNYAVDGLMFYGMAISDAVAEAKEVLGAFSDKSKDYKVLDAVKPSDRGCKEVYTAIGAPGKYPKNADDMASNQFVAMLADAYRTDGVQEFQRALCAIGWFSKKAVMEDLPSEFWQALAKGNCNARTNYTLVLSLSRQ